MSGSGRVALPDVRESPWMSGSGLEALKDVCEWSGGPPRYPGVFGRPSRIPGSGREAFLDVREWLGGPPG